ncbi:monovalent cation/H(+) antiporter subunit G [Anderseniella sp. Alg231-50]|uniref:monovalent cation/H(+) antiporter subunit G n=1 Tax=Anderseniella sp. Alg231-50 TaxID=1922226 RepID=UPI000D54E660
MDLLLDIASAVLLLAGGFFVFVGGFGVMRMPEFFTRMHAASLTDTGGAALILIGLMLQGGFTLVPLKLAAIFLFLFLTSPTASYALANAALLSGVKTACRNETGTPLPENDPAIASVTQTAAPAAKDTAGKTVAKKAAKKTATRKPAKKAAKKPAKKPAKKTARKKS